MESMTLIGAMTIVAVVVAAAYFIYKRRKGGMKTKGITADPLPPPDKSHKPQP